MRNICSRELGSSAETERAPEYAPAKNVLPKLGGHFH
jgi:hypothetical protein